MTADSSVGGRSERLRERERGMATVIGYGREKGGKAKKGAVELL